MFVISKNFGIVLFWMVVPRQWHVSLREWPEHGLHSRNGLNQVLLASNGPTITFSTFIVVSKIVVRRSLSLDGIYILECLHDDFWLLRDDHKVVDMGAQIVVVFPVFAFLDPHIVVVSCWFESQST